MVITAQEARNMVNARKSNQADRINKRIKAAAKDGDTYNIFRENLESGMREYLTELGYKVSWHAQQAYKIEW